MGYAVVIPSLSMQLGYSFNFLSSSYTAEAIAILKAMKNTINEGEMVIS